IGDSYTEKAALNKSSKVLLDSAGYYLNKSIDMHRQLNSIRGLYDDYSSLTALEKLRGNYRGALGAFEKAITYKDSIFNTDNRETIKNLEDKRAIEVRDRELKINKITLQAEEKQKWFLVFGIGLLVVIAVLLFYQNRSRKTANKKLSVLNNSLDNANRTKTRLLSILNHDLRSPVNSFIHFLQLQKESPELLDDESKMRIENATVKSATNLLDSMEDMLLWTKDQMETLEPQFEPVAMDKIFETLKKHFSGASGVSLVFENRESINVTTDPNYLKAILRNLISNAVKAVSETDNAEIIVSAFSENGKPIITVTDNGAGATEDHFRALYDATETIGASHG
ncbi:MAG: HAMP domain-containing histidine kinase, partial [Flavobacterium sp.]